MTIRDKEGETERVDGDLFRNAILVLATCVIVWIESS